MEVKIDSDKLRLFKGLLFTREWPVSMFNDVSEICLAIDDSLKELPNEIESSD